MMTKSRPSRCVRERAPPRTPQRPLKPVSRSPSPYQNLSRSRSPRYNQDRYQNRKSIRGKEANMRQPKIGQKMPDGTVYAGISPDTGNPMYTTPEDPSLAMTFNEAADYAARLNAHGHRDWRLPTKAELNVLFNNRAAIGGFRWAEANAYNQYWSSTKYY